MVWIYIFMIALAAVPLTITIYRMRKAGNIKKHGVHVDAIVKDKRAVRIGKSPIDMLTLEYKDRATGRPYYGKASTGQGKFKIGDRMPVAYLPDDPAKYAVLKTGYWPVLVFCIILFLFVIFAVYKIDEMVSGKNIQYSGSLKHTLQREARKIYKLA
jgi:hypothetical protein